MEKVKREQIARAALEKLLLQGEQLLAVGEFLEQPSFARSVLEPPIIGVLTQKHYWVGVTRDRVIFIPLDAGGMPYGTGNYALVRTDVVYKSLMLHVVLPNSPKTQKLVPHFGIKKLSGLDEIAFRKVMNSARCIQTPFRINRFKNHGDTLLKTVAFLGRTANRPRACPSPCLACLAPCLA